MGSIKKASETAGELQHVAPQKTMRDMIEVSWPKIAATLPKHMDSERFMQLAISTVNTTPKLAECQPASVLSALMRCATLGIEPSAVDGLGRAYILPYRDNKSGGYIANFILGYRGMIDLARKGGVSEIYAEIVYENDEFEYKSGANRTLHHKPDVFSNERGAIRGAYCVAKFEGGEHIEVMSADQIDSVKKRSKSLNSSTSPWKTDECEMIKKTVVRRAFKWLPVSTDIKSAAIDDDFDTEKKQDYTTMISTTLDVIPEIEPQKEEGTLEYKCQACGEVKEMAPDVLESDLLDIVCDSCSTSGAWER